MQVSLIGTNRQNPAIIVSRLKTGIKTESSVTERCGIQYYQFPTAANYGLVLDMITPHEEEGSQETSIKKVDNRSIQGYRKYIKDNQTRRIYFFIQFSQDVNVWAGNDSLRPLANGKRITLPQSYAWIDFGQITNKIIAKISISSANSDGAIANLNKEIPHWSFDKVKRDAKQQWRRTLSRIRIKTDSSETAKIFYTALYHAYLTPSVYSDVHGNYTGVDGEVHSVGKGIQYKLAPLQYTCWTQYPLLTITQREKANEIIQSLLIHYDQTGILPRGIIPQRAIRQSGHIRYHGKLPEGNPQFRHRKSLRSHQSHVNQSVTGNQRVTSVPLYSRRADGTFRFEKSDPRL